MDTLIAIFNFIALNYQMVLASVVAILTAVIAICLVIPGEQPEKALQGVVDFLTKFSKK